AAVLPANRMDDARVGEAERAVELHGRRVCGVADYGHHLPVARSRTPSDQLLEQGACDAAALSVCCDIDRVLDGEAVAGAWPVRARVAVTDDASVTLGDEIGIAGPLNNLEAATHLRFIRRLVLPAREPIADG